MVHLKLPPISNVTCAVLLMLGSALHAQSLPGNEPEMKARLQALQQELSDQKMLLMDLESTRQQYFEQGKQLQSLERQVNQQQAAIDELRGAVSWSVLATQRAAGAPGTLGDAAAPAQDKTAQAAPMAQDSASPSGASGMASETQGRPPEVAPLFEQPGVLTGKNHYVLEPSVQYSYSSNNRVALVGYTIIPALLIGLIDVREVKRNTLTAALSGRYGLTNRLELELRVPYVDRIDATVSREVNAGAATDNVFSASGLAVGDVELGARYQLNDGGIDKPFYIGSVRYKSRTGTDPFSVVTNCVTRCDVNGAGSGLPLELPTGSGFESLQLGLTMLFPSDPAVFFGSVSYLHNFARDNVSRKVLYGLEEPLGTIAPGDVIGFNFGMGLALNEKSSFSIGYDLNSVGRTEVNGQVAKGSVRTALGTLLLGYSYRLSPKTTLNVSVGAGLTRDTPDMTLTVRLPMTF